MHVAILGIGKKIIRKVMVIKMSVVEDLYGQNIDGYQKRKNKLLKAYAYHFNEEADSMFSSSGRVELLGNHTDHNHGKVLVGAIDMDILAAANASVQNEIVFVSEGYDKMVVSLDDLEVKPEEYSTSIALIRGCAKGFVDRGYQVGGLNVKAISNIAHGAGISSSAAFELLVCEMLNYYYNNDEIGPIELAKIAQYAETVYFNKPCGLLDQMGIALGGVNYIDFADEEHPKVESLNAHLDGYTILLLNTGGNHSGLTNYYAEIKQDMRNVASVFNKQFLAEVTYRDFIKHLPTVVKRYGGRATLRALHFMDENKRVEKGFESLKKGDLPSFFDMINRSGESSYKYLQNCYCPDDSEEGIALGLILTRRFIKECAVRVHGGGFAGTILAIIPTPQVKMYYDFMQVVFGENSISRVVLRNHGATHVEKI